MVMKMNKDKFIKELSKQTEYDETKCEVINQVLEKYFIFKRNNKDKIIKELQVSANLSEDDSENVYDISIKIIKKEIKNKLKHPFKGQD